MNWLDVAAIGCLIYVGIKGATMLDQWEARMDSDVSEYTDLNTLRAVEDERLAVYQDPPYNWEDEMDDREDENDDA